MIFDSLGVGELGVVLALAVVLIEPKKLGKVIRGFASFKRKVTRIQSEVKSQLDALVIEDESKERRDKLQGDKAGMRRWGREQVQALPAAVREEAARTILQTLVEWPTYQTARVVSCFVGTLDEVDTSLLLRRILEDGKTLLVPFVREETPGGGKSMGMSAITDLDKDLREGSYRILEPVPELRTAGEGPKPDMVLVPGLCFDFRGGRVGKGLGFYDKYLAEVQTLKVGLCYDVQITQKNLALDFHDRIMDVLLTDKRLRVLSMPLTAAAEGER